MAVVVADGGGGGYDDEDDGEVDDDYDYDVNVVFAGIRAVGGASCEHGPLSWVPMEPLECVTIILLI